MTVEERAKEIVLRAIKKRSELLKQHRPLSEFTIDLTVGEQFDLVYDVSIYRNEKGEIPNLHGLTIITIQPDYRLYNAKQGCPHVIEVLNSGVKCSRCGGWFCA